MVEWLDSMGVSAYGKPSAPGVYVAAGGREAKIAALGLKVRNGCTYHGLAVNVAMDLSPFTDIDPCGYPGLAVTQLADLGIVRTVEAAGAELAPILARRLRGTRSNDHAHRPVAVPANAAGVKHKGDAKTARIPIKVVATERLKKPDWIRVRAASSPRYNEIKSDPARAPAAHGVRGGVVPEHRRVLRQGHRDVHDHGRHVHAALPVLRRRTRPAAAARRRRARQPGEDDRGAEAFLRRDHERRSRRPARRRRAAFRRLHPRGARAFAAHADRGAGARLSRPPRPRARHSGAGAAGCDEPQSRNGAAALQAGATRVRLRAFTFAARAVQGALPRHPDQVGTDGRARRNRRRDRGHDARHARARHRHADDRPVSAADDRPPSRPALRAPGHLRDVRARGDRHGVPARRRGRARALVVPRRSPGARG